MSAAAAAVSAARTLAPPTTAMPSVATIIGVVRNKRGRCRSLGRERTRASSPRRSRQVCVRHLMSSPSSTTPNPPAAASPAAWSLVGVVVIIVAKPRDGGGCGGAAFSVAITVAAADAAAAAAVVSRSPASCRVGTSTSCPLDTAASISRCATSAS